MGCPRYSLALAVLIAGSAWTAAQAQEDTVLVSVSEAGEGSYSFSVSPAISVDGRFVAFESSGALLPGIVKEPLDSWIYLRDLATGGLTGIARGILPSITPDGRTVVYGDQSAIYAYDRLSGDIALLGSGGARTGLSHDGRYVAYLSDRRIYVLDRATGERELISGDPAGTPANPLGATGYRPAMSADGRWVAFTSLSPNLVEGDTNGTSDVFVHDRATGRTSLISRSSGGMVGDAMSRWPVMSADGRFVAFVSRAGNFDGRGADGDDDIYLHDRMNGTTILVSVAPVPGSESSSNDLPAISADGRFVTYDTWHRTPVPSRPARQAGTLFRYDRITGETEVVSVRADGSASEAETNDYGSALSGDGSHIAFGWDEPLLPGIPEDRVDVYLRRMSPPGGGAGSALLAAVAPGSRAGRVGTTTTAFGVLLNNGAEAALGCRVLSPLDAPMAFSYQTTDPATNLLVGMPDTPVDVPAGASQTFLLAFKPEAVVPPQHLGFGFECDNALPAATRPWVNTLLYSAGTDPVPDPIAIYATLEGDGTVRVSSSPSQPAFFTVAGVNIGAAGTLNAVPVADGSLPVDLLVCETDPGTGACKVPPGPTTSAVFPRDTIRTFSVFLFGQDQPIPTDYVNGRARLEFRDTAGAVRGATSVVVLPKAEG